MGAIYNHYKGNTGQVRRIEEQPAAERGRPYPLPLTEAPPLPAAKPKKNHSAPLIRPLSPLTGLSGELGRMAGKLSAVRPEPDDLLILLILYLLYKESGDEELLFIMAAMVFL